MATQAECYAWVYRKEFNLIEKKEGRDKAIEWWQERKKEMPHNEEFLAEIVKEMRSIGPNDKHPILGK